MPKGPLGAPLHQTRDDNSFSPKQWETKGPLAPHVTELVMIVLYVARVYRWDLLWTTNWLAMQMAKWSQAKLKRRIAYMKATGK